MRFSIAAAALVAGVSAQQYGGYGNYTEAPSYTTEVVTQYTTYCPGPTEITHGGVTYTATSETTLTITNCPCTITYPVTSSVVTECSTCSTYAPPTTYAPPPPATYTPPYVNTTSVYYPSTTVPSSPPVYTPTGSPIPSGGANKAVAVSGAGLAAIFGFALAL